MNCKFTIESIKSRQNGRELAYCYSVNNLQMNFFWPLDFFVSITADSGYPNLQTNLNLEIRDCSKKVFRMACSFSIVLNQDSWLKKLIQIFPVQQVTFYLVK